MRYCAKPGCDQEDSGTGLCVKHSPAAAHARGEQALDFLVDQVETIKEAVYAIDVATRIPEIAAQRTPEKWKRIGWVLAKLVVFGLDEKIRRKP